MASQVIHPYDYVRIKIPKFFVRCGYKLEYETEVDRIYKEHAGDIMAFMHKVGITIPEYFGDHYRPRTPDKIARAIAYDILRQKKFGGPERKIYTLTIPEYEGKDFHVRSVRFVRTGTYEPGYTSRSYDGEIDTTLPQLNDAKTHRIVTTPFMYERPYRGRRVGIRDWSDLEIEADNLQILTTPVIHKKKRRNGIPSKRTL